MVFCSRRYRQEIVFIALFIKLFADSVDNECKLLLSSIIRKRTLPILSKPSVTTQAVSVRQDIHKAFTRTSHQSHMFEVYYTYYDSPI